MYQPQLDAPIYSPPMYHYPGNVPYHTYEANQLRFPSQPQFTSQFQSQPTPQPDFNAFEALQENIFKSIDSNSTEYKDEPNPRQLNLESRRRKKGRGDNQNWTPDEEMALAKACVDTSKDTILGDDQDGDTFM